MARVGTTNLNLGTWLDAENPGAGSQSVDNTGLNGNWLKLDTAVGAEHNTNGTHKDDKIGGNVLKNSIADGTTIEASASTGAKTFRVKDGGISTAKIADDAVTAAKISHDNKRTKERVWFYINASDEYARVAGVIMTSTLNLVIGRAGSVTGLYVCGANGTVLSDTVAYGTAGNTFGATDKMSIKHFAVGASIQVHAAATQTDLEIDSTSLTFPIIGCVEFELDD